MFKTLLFFIVLPISQVMAQDLTGIWRGHFKSDNVSRLMEMQGIEDRFKFETQITQHGKTFEGVTYSYKTTVFYGKAACVGSVNKANKKVLLQETKITEVQSTGDVCIMTCFLQYSKVNNEEFLEGKYTSISTTDSSFCGVGTVFLRKVESSDFYREPFLTEKEKEDALPKSNPPVVKSPPKQPPAPPSKKEVSPQTKKSPGAAPPVISVPEKSVEIKKLPPERAADSPASIIHESVPILESQTLPGVLLKRKNEVVRTITTPAREITVKIYDNGTIDNDTVSVYFNNKLIVSRQRLTDQPITLKLNLQTGRDLHELVMVAENLGEIPPNTSLMVVNAGDKQYEVRITSNEQKNAVVQFRHAE